jgi:excinuclease UvrABC nuclease subunit
MDYPPPVPAQSAAQAEPAGEGGDAARKPEIDAITRALPGGGGVYLLTDEQDRLVLLSAAADLRRVLRSRLLEAPVAEGEGQSPAARRKARLGEIVRRIYWQPSHSVFETDYRYLDLARQIMPDKYLKNLAFGPSWFVQVDPEAPIPRFTVAKVISDTAAVLGPFPTQPDAHRFIQTLEDAFDLCRCQPVLEQAPHGARCAYYEMGKCLGACAGMIPMEQYRGIIRAALAFACGEREPFFRQWEDRMRQLAAEWAYERAAAVKQRIDRARTVEQAAFRHVRPIEDFNFLVVQRGRGRTSAKPFFVRAGRIEPGEAISLKKVDAGVTGWVNAVRSGEALAGGEAGDCQSRSEQIWLVSHYLFKSEPRGLFFHASALDNPESVAQRIKERFGGTADETETLTT